MAPTSPFHLLIRRQWSCSSNPFQFSTCLLTAHRSPTPWALRARTGPTHSPSGGLALVCFPLSFLDAFSSILLHKCPESQDSSAQHPLLNCLVGMPDPAVFPNTSQSLKELLLFYMYVYTNIYTQSIHTCIFPNSCWTFIKKAFNHSINCVLNKVRKE